MSDISIMDLLEIKKHIDNGAFKVVEVQEEETGGATVNVEVTEDFIKWFKQREGLQRWSNRRFQKFFDNNLQKFLRLGTQTEK
tara:strand:+ start:2591 stop:2839 length:249 start_codon:yes stop_codon:yes gene_type:complete